MASSRFDAAAERPAERECANCASTDNLLRCSRCRTEWFCSLACHKAYWPFHKAFCRRNDFADCLEAADPRFAAWLRRHGKQAVLGDAEVDRLERAGRAACGPGRDDVMHGMYGKLDPRPEGPRYSPEEVGRMQRRAIQEAREARHMSRQDKAWSDIVIQPGMGLECARYKWTQNQSHVYLYTRLPPGLHGGHVRVDMAPDSLRVVYGAPRDEEPYLYGTLYGAVKAEACTWFIDDGVLQVQLLKAHRRGHYAAGTTNAATWWRSVWAHCPPAESLDGSHPPTLYYWAEYEEQDLVPEVVVTGAQGRQRALTGGSAGAVRGALPPPPPQQAA